MYSALAARMIRRAFGHLSAGDHTSVIALLAEDVHHVFAGEHALGGERHTRDAVARWFARLSRLFPSIHFEVGSVVVSGLPWNLWVAVEWIGDVTPAAGEQYQNEGTHVINIRRGRVVYFHAYEDSQKVARACEQMAALGIDEAAAPPITD
jgi:ketosteroid isomerase-like protein